jgi:hypothetical protein
MGSDVANEAGEVVERARSDMEAARWFLRSGRRGDYLAETGELMSSVVEVLWPHVTVRFDRNGCVVPQDVAD